jgi:hypothetical protein
MRAIFFAEDVAAVAGFAAEAFFPPRYFLL